MCEWGCVKSIGYPFAYASGKFYVLRVKSVESGFDVLRVSVWTINPIRRSSGEWIVGISA